jgi:type II secretory pathway pseudopilin PulG
MFIPLIEKNKKSGLTLVESLVGIGLLLIVFIGIFGLVRLNIKIVAQSKSKTIATALANQKIELARNLAYDQVGTVGGIPSGVIPETENI